MRIRDADRLDALADLLDAGHPPAEALHALERLGGPVAAWARPLITGVRGGAPLGMILAQAGVLSSPELIWIGGAEHAGRAPSLRVVAAQRRARRIRRRTLWAAMAIPAAMTVLASGSGGFILSQFGGKTGGFLVDVFPLLLIAAAVGWGLMDRQRSLYKLKSLPLIGRWVQQHQQARLAEALGAGLSRPGGEVDALQTAARLADAPALAQIAERVKGGTAFADTLPRVEQIGEPLALCIASGQAAGDLPQRLAAFAADLDADLTVRLARLVKLLSWLVVLWAYLRTLWAFADITLFGGGGGSGGLLPGLPGGLPGIDPGDLQELQRELGL